MIPPFLLFTCLLASPVAPPQQSEDGARPPLGRHLRQLEDLAQVSGVAVDDGGRVWALERQAGRLWRMEGEQQRTLLAEGLGRPLDVELGAEGELFVSAGDGPRVWRLDREGKVLAEIAVPGRNASGLAWSPERLYVTDTGTHRVEVLDPHGKSLFGFGEHGTGPGQFIAPSDVAVSADGTLFVADGGNSRVQAFDARGTFLHEFGDWGPFPGLFFQPSGIEVRGEEVYVSDFGNHRVQVFNLKGELVDRFGLHAIRPREGRGYLHYPSSLGLSPSGEFAAVGEPWVDRVQVFCRTGGIPEDAVRRQAMQLAKPSAHYGMDFACAGEFLFIAEPESHSVVVYENSAEDPRRISRLGGLGTKTGLLTGVAGLHFDPQALELWVADPILRRLSLYRLPGLRQEEVGFDALLPRFVKSLDLAKLHELELSERLEEVPEVIALDKDAAGRLHALDGRNGAVILLSPDLSVLEVFGHAELQRPTAIEVNGAGDQVFVADGEGEVWRFAGEERAGKSLLEGFTPHGLALDEGSGRLFVTDPVLHRVHRLHLEGGEHVNWGGEGLERGEFYKPRDIAIDHRGELLMLDHGNHRLVRMTTDGEYRACAGPRLYTRLLRYPELAGKQDQGQEEEGE